MSKKRSAKVELAEFVSQFYHDPAGFAKVAFGWGEGALANLKGPLAWQLEILEEIGKEVRARGFDGIHAVRPIRVAVSSGHGIAKTTLSSIIACWILSTRPKSRGKVTAQSWVQVESTTWASIRFWMSQCITNSWFEVGAQRIRHKQFPDVWYCTAESPKEENSQSFAGQHASDSTSWILIDEASEFSEKIYEVVHGAMTDGEPMLFMMGNPTRNVGIFHDVVFGDGGDGWMTRIIDSREVEITNKEEIQDWVNKHGEDSDFVRVRVKGVPPRASAVQFIGTDLVKGAQSREAICLDDDPLIAGADISRGGEDNTVIRFRRGMDARSIPPIKLSAEVTRDSMRVVQVLADLMHRDFGKGLKLAHLFIDETGVGGPLVNRLHEMGHKRVTGVNFGRTPPEEGCLNMRSYMWSKMRDWLQNGSIESDDDLIRDLIGPGYKFNAQSKLVLESKDDMKRRRVGSPDDGDALALTFAANVSPRKSVTSYSRRDSMIRSLRNGSPSAWMS